ncbi:hypothetical protein [Thauera sp. SWB20]|uniref:hypothetical protein n=1 Tax=Thauera sp. SWB20 TaxID=1572758 RepID=UPI0005ADAA33|nr:hypothetical protein [Thauera sp. SWB20]KIN91846.1 hypothetical protein PO78_3606 [Thauera sp. SWB20]
MKQKTVASLAFERKKKHTDRPPVRRERPQFVAFRTAIDECPPGRVRVAEGPVRRRADGVEDRLAYLDLLHGQPLQIRFLTFQ